MKKNIFKLTTKQLKEIAKQLQSKIEDGLAKEGKEVACLPTFITPKKEKPNGKALVLDLGGTNYRAAIVDFVDGQPEIHPENGWSKDLSVMKTPGYTQEQLFKEMADLITEYQPKEELPIGYCFSYPAESLTDGDGKLLRWTKGVNIEEMVGMPIGTPLKAYLNKLKDNKFTEVRVINDTVASLFAGAMYEADAHIGLIVGTGTNMATFIRSNKINKLPKELQTDNLIPVNLESGNFKPKYLTSIDDIVDGCSNNRGAQRFEKAISGMYLGEILKSVYPYDTFEKDFNAKKLTSIMSYPDIHKEKYVRVSHWIYKRSAQLVAASLAGLILVLLSHDKTIKTIQLTAEGSLFWSKDQKTEKEGDREDFMSYKDTMLEELYKILASFGYKDIRIRIDKINNANLIGSAVAALS